MYQQSLLSHLIGVIICLGKIKLSQFAIQVQISFLSAFYILYMFVIRHQGDGVHMNSESCLD